MPPGCVNVSDAVYVPPEVVAKVYPASGPTVMSALVSAEPLIVNEFGPAVVFRHTPQKAVNAVALNVGVNESVVNVCSAP